MNNSLTYPSPPPTVQPISPDGMLRIWERGQFQSPVQRALSMLSAACPDAPNEQLVALSIGQRDVCLLQLRELLFGAELSSIVDCPGCNERLEMSFTTADMRMPPGWEAERLTVEHDGRTARLRLPTSADLLALRAGSVEQMSDELFGLCLLDARPEPLLEGFLEAASPAMADADPQAEVKLALTCPCCQRQWKAVFDVASYLWREVQERAGQLLREVHILAAAYGWREGEILALSPWRRQFYLEMLAR